MAVSIPSGIYSLGAVQFNAQPLAALEGQLLAKRAAREQALDDALEKYNQDKINRTTTTGMASNDLDAFTKMYKDIQSYYSQNKDRIARDPSLKYEYNNKWRNLENLVAESKGKIEEAKKPESLLYDKNFRDEGNSEELMKGIHTHNEPLYIQDARGNFVRNPNRKRFEYNENLYLPKEIDYGKIFDEFSKGFKGDTELSVVQGSEKLPENKKNFQYDIVKGHGRDAVIGITENSFNAISQDKGLMSSLQKKVEKTSPKELAYYWDKYTKNFHPEIEPDDPRSLLIGKLAEQAELRQFKAKKTDERAKAAYGSALISSRDKKSGVGGIDLSNYPTVGDSKDVTDLFQGIKVTGLPKGEGLIAKKVFYNPSTKEVTLTEWVGRDVSGNPKGESTRKLPFNTLLQNIRALNPGTDIKYIETLSSAIGGGKESNKVDNSDPLGLGLKK